MSRSKETAFSLKEMLAPDLALRDTADRLFNAIDVSSSEAVKVDFMGVRSITRSFAHQYLARKKASSKAVLEKNMSESIRRMFLAVKRTPTKSKLVMLNRVKARPLKVDLRAYLF